MMARGIPSIALCQLRNSRCRVINLAVCILLVVLNRKAIVALLVVTAASCELQQYLYLNRL